MAYGSSDTIRELTAENTTLKEDVEKLEAETMDLLRTAIDLREENKKYEAFVEKIEGIAKYVSQLSVPKPQVYRRLILALRDVKNT